MNLFNSIRVYHIVLAALALFAYFNDHGRVHAYVGYAVTAVIAFRLLASLAKVPELKLSRFIPSFKGFDVKKANILAHPAVGRTIMLVMVLALVGAVGTGIALDKGRALGFGEPRVHDRGFGEGIVLEDGTLAPRPHREASLLKETHETLADLFFVFAILHVGYAFAYKRPMAKLMLFMKKPSNGPTAAR